MTIDRWLASSIADARGRDLAEIVPLLEGLAEALTALRGADFNDDASGATRRAGHESAPAPPTRRPMP